MKVCQDLTCRKDCAKCECNPCMICQKPIPDFKPEYCCDGVDCGCMGMPIYPCVCSDKCYEALMKGIGKPYDERRKDAGIAVYRCPDDQYEIDGDETPEQYNEHQYINTRQ